MSIDQETAQANLYKTLARTLSSPLEMTSEHPAQLRSAILDLDPDLQEAARVLANAWEHALQNREALTLSYTRLFLGPFEIMAPPYASFYLEPDQSLMGPVSNEVARTYADAGLAPGPGPREAPDHAAVELEFMYFLTYQYLTSEDDRWLEQRRQFVATHVKHWMPAFAHAVRKADQHPLYNAVADLLRALTT